jgi:hypothetical protein
MAAPTSVLLKERDGDLPLLVDGQGVFLFENGSGEAVTFYFYGAGGAGLKVCFTSSAVIVTRLPSGDELLDNTNTCGLSQKEGAYYWFSLDSQNQRIRAGVGEARLKTMIYHYKFAPEDKKFLESLTNIKLESVSIKPMKMLRDPITTHIPMLIKETGELTMADIAKGEFLPKAYLSNNSQRLYDCIAGKKFVLNDREFPEFSKAIEYSIATPGLWCYQRLLEKANEFGGESDVGTRQCSKTTDSTPVPRIGDDTRFGKPAPLETYLRITLNENNGESPGIPYVMEIWPPGHYSPVHNHAGADAIIRVLHGRINVSLYPFLSTDGVDPVAAAEFKKGDITWISPTLNQVHQLINKDTQTCITIQCYMYEESDTVHYDYFDYLDANKCKKQYEPDSDMAFMKFKKLMKREWAARPRWWC